MKKQHNTEVEKKGGVTRVQKAWVQNLPFFSSDFGQFEYVWFSVSSVVS